MSFTTQNCIDTILDRLNASADEFWLTANFLLYAKDFLRRTDVREACWHQAYHGSIVTVADQQAYALPADLFRPEAVFWTLAGKDYPLDPGSLGDRGGNPSWQIRGGQLWIEPAPQTDQAGVPVKVYYIRLPTLPSNVSTAVDAPDDLQEAMTAYLLARAWEKAGPENAQRAAHWLQLAEQEIAKAKVARSDNRGDVGFRVRARW